MSMKQKIKKILRTIVLLCKEREIIPVLTPVDYNCLLRGKVALITGGSSGIGFAIAQAFVRSGCHVIIAGRKENILKDSCSYINNINNTCTGEVAKYIVLDVLDVTSMPEKIRLAASFFDKGRIDILVNSAGLTVKLPFEHTTEAEYDAVMGTNAKGTFFMCKAMAQYMIENNIKGHILNVTSSSALRPAWTPYHMSKWAVRGFTLGLADMLLPYGIIVNAIGPGPTATPMLNKKQDESLYLGQCVAGRYAHPMEIASLAVFMVSDMGNLIIGDTFYITGGRGTISYHR